MHASFRRRRTIRLPIYLSVVLMALNIALMVCWILLLAQLNSWSALTIGTVFFALILIGTLLYLFLTIKEVRLNQRQSNFVDSVTHELKSPIASLKLYLETLQMRELSDEQRADFLKVMDAELVRLDRLINQLLETARLDAIGHETEPERIQLEPLLQKCAETACGHYKKQFEDVFTIQGESVVVNARRIVLEMIFGNLFDNAIKYSLQDPKIDVSIQMKSRNRALIQIADNGIGVPQELRKNIFRLFVRGGNELERTRKGTGLGLYIVKTLVQTMRGKVYVQDRAAGPGSVFVVELPGRLTS